MKRVRLTSRKAADGSIPYPGNVNQTRTDPAWDQYHTFEQQVNHELPDMRTEWKDDSRDDIGFGIPDSNPPTVASVRIAANKAVRIAVLLLGEKVSDSVIEAQARDLMTLSSESMDRTLDRFAKTQKLYADEECEEEVEAKAKKSADEKEEVKEEKTASAGLADKGGVVPPAISLKETEVKADDKKEEKKEEVKEEPKVEAKADDKKEEVKEEVKADDKKEEKKEEVKEDDKVEARLAKMEAMIATLAVAVHKPVVAEEKKMPDFIQKKIDEKKDDKKAADEKKEEVKEEVKEEKKAADEKDEADEDTKEASAQLAGPNEMDIELTGSMDEIASDPVADAQLASLFSDDITAATEENDDADKKAKVKKAGIKKLGGQPRVAATEVTASADISSIWQSAPDVSEVFR